MGDHLRRLKHSRNAEGINSIAEEGSGTALVEFTVMSSSLNPMLAMVPSKRLIRHVTVSSVVRSAKSTDAKINGSEAVAVFCMFSISVMALLGSVFKMEILSKVLMPLALQSP